MLHSKCTQQTTPNVGTGPKSNYLNRSIRDIVRFECIIEYSMIYHHHLKRTFGTVLFVILSKVTTPLEKRYFSNIQSIPFHGNKRFFGVKCVNV